MTEAEELLRVGKLIRPRAGLRSEEGGLTLAGFKPGGFLLYRDDEPLDHFDLDGRWQRCFRNGRHYLRKLDGSVVAVDRERKGAGLEVARTLLGPEDAAGLDRAIRSDARELRESLRAKALEIVPPPDIDVALDEGRLAEFLDLILLRDEADWGSQQELYRRAYIDLGPIPPGCATALPLQATVSGRARTEAEFAAHLQNIRALWGRRAEQCGSILLLGTDAWQLGFDHLEAKARAIREIFAGSGSIPSGFHLFMEGFDAKVLAPGAWKKAADAGVVRVHLRMPIGDALREAAVTIRDGGVPIDLLLDDPTPEEIRRLDLARGDRVVVLSGDARALREALAAWLKERKAAVVAAAEGF